MASMTEIMISQFQRQEIQKIVGGVSSVQDRRVKSIPRLSWVLGVAGDCWKSMAVCRCCTSVSASVCAGGFLGSVCVSVSMCLCLSPHFLFL